MKRKKNSLMQQGVGNAMALTGMGIGLGAGGAVLGPLSASTGINLGGGISAFSGFMPAMGSVMGAGMVLGAMNEFMPRYGRRRRR